MRDGLTTPRRTLLNPMSDPIQSNKPAEARSAPRPCSALEEVLSEWERKDPRDFPVRFAAIIHGSEAEDVADHLEYMAAQLRHKGFSDGTGGGRNVTMAWATHSANTKGDAQPPTKD